MGGFPLGLDFGAIMLVGAGQGVDLELLAEVLPDFEAAVLAGLSDESPDDFSEEEVND